MKIKTGKTYIDVPLPNLQMDKKVMIQSAILYQLGKFQELVKILHKSNINTDNVHKYFKCDITPLPRGRDIKKLNLDSFDKDIKEVIAIPFEQKCPICGEGIC